jgi:hypothetical protein
MDEFLAVVSAALATKIAEDRAGAVAGGVVGGRGVRVPLSSIAGRC